MMERLGHYRILENIGEGGMGVVYRAVDERLGREVALKVLSTAALSNPERKARFIQEARAASALNHPNIVTIYDVGSDGGIDYIAMEYVKGKTLDHVIPRKGLGISEVLSYAVQVTDAMAVAHEAGIVHRDLKPGNLIVSDRGVVKVLDFGLAKLTEPAVSGDCMTTLTAGGTAVATAEGKIVGTVAYMSPEQAQAKPLDSRSDIFSLGCILYEMLAGQRPFRGETTVSTISAILKDEPAPLRQHGDAIPPELDRLVGRCLRKDPDRRFQHMSDLRVALAELKEESDSGTLARPEVARARTRRRVLWSATAALVLLGAAAGAFMWWQYRQQVDVKQFRITPLTSYRGSEFSPDFSPDGKYVVFVWDGPEQNNFDLYLKMIGSEPPLRLTTTPEMDGSPAWSHDGQWIAFVRGDFSLQRSVWIISPLGGGERKIVDIPGLPCERGVSWTSDSKSLIVSLDTGAGTPKRLTAVSILTGEQHPVLEPLAGSRGDCVGSLSPEGRRLAFMRYVGLSPTIHVADVSPDMRAGTTHAVTTPALEMVWLSSWTPDGRSLLATGLRRDVRTNLWRLSPDGRSPPEMLAFGEEGFDATASRTGDRVAYSRRNSDLDLWRFANGSNSAPSPLGEKVASSTAVDLGGRYSPDCKQIVFESARSGRWELWVANADGSSPRQLTTTGGETPDWSPEGLNLVFMSDGVLYIIPAAGGVRTKLDVGHGGAARPSYSADGKFVYFTSERSGRSEVWKIYRSGGEPVQVTREGGEAARESPDGKWLYISKTVQGSASDSLYLRPVHGGPEQLVGAVLHGAANLAFHGSRLYFTPTGKPDDAAEIHEFDPVTRHIRRVLTLPKRQRFVGRGLSISPDGKWFLCALWEFDMDLMLVEGFR